MSPFSDVNKISIPGHQGPHGYYNEYVLEELRKAVAGATEGTLQYQQKLFTGLVKLRSRLRDPGDLQPLVTTSTTKFERRQFR